MKKLVISFALSLYLFACQSTETISINSIPKDVQENFNKSHPYAHSLHWESKDGLYIAKFTNVAEEQKVAYYNQNGSLLKID